MAKKMMDGMMGEMKEKEDSSEMEEMDEYEVKDAAQCLMRAAEIKQDKKLYAAAMEQLQKKKSAIESIADLRAKAYDDADSEESTPESKKKDK